ncbi:MAG: NHL repeat-containing protein, partial [Planctomycetota bacterium]
MSGPALAHFEDGQVWLIDTTNNKVYRINVDTGFVNESLDVTDGLNSPGAIGFSLHGHLLVANFGDNVVYEFDANLLPEVVLTGADGIAGPFGGNGIVLGPGHGDVYISNLNTSEVMKFTEDYVFEEVVLDGSDGLVLATAMAFLPDGDLLVANRGGNGEIFHVDEAGVVSVYTTLPGVNPAAMVVRDNGDVYVATVRGEIYRMIGGDPNNMVLLGDYATGVSSQAIHFNADYSVLYHVATNDGIFRGIDPDAGTQSVIATVNGNPSAMVVVGSHYPHGTFVEFGESLAGTGGVEPTLHGHGEPRIGQSADIELHEFVGGSQLFVFVSPFADESELFGGEFHIQLGPGTAMIELSAGGTPGVAGAASLEIPFTLPNLPQLVGVKFYLQALGTDAGAP